MRSFRFVSLIAAGVLVAWACGDEEFNAPSPVTLYRASLDGAQERPTPVTTTATGTSLISIEGNLLHVWVFVNGIDSVTACHIHGGTPDVAGGVMVGLCTFTTGRGFTGTLRQDTIRVVDSVLNRIRAGSQAYVNVHTRRFGGGEIRGNILPP